MLPLQSPLLQCQKPVRQHHQARVVVEPPPGAALVVVQPQLLLHLLVTEFDRPAAPPQPHRPDPAGIGREVAEGVLELAVGLPLDQQPDRLRPGAIARPPPPAHPPSPPPGPARPAARRIGPTSGPSSPPSRSPSAAAPAPPAPSGSP